LARVTFVVQFSDPLQAGRFGDQNPLEGNILFRLPTIPDLPWASLKTIARFFPGRKWPRILFCLHLHVWVSVYVYLGIYFNVIAVRRVGIHVIGWLKSFSVNENRKTNTTNFNAKKNKETNISRNSFEQFLNYFIRTDRMTEQL
jgi:hypothetical protein